MITEKDLERWYDHPCWTEETFSFEEQNELLRLARLGLWAESHAIPALEEFRLGHEHAAGLNHTRALGDTYGWCDFCGCKVDWGPGAAETALAALPTRTQAETKKGDGK